jgi:hypothetical protein
MVIGELVPSSMIHLVPKAFNHPSTISGYMQKKPIPIGREFISKLPRTPFFPSNCMSHRRMDFSIPTVGNTS